MLIELLVQFADLDILARLHLCQIDARLPGTASDPYPTQLVFATCIAKWRTILDAVQSPQRALQTQLFIKSPVDRQV